jgi:hypothetical protein
MDNHSSIIWGIVVLFYCVWNRGDGGVEIKNKEIVVTVILGIAELLVNIIAYFNGNYLVYLMQLGISLSLVAIIIFLYIKYKSFKHLYMFVTYLFFDNEYNKFNYLPKVILYTEYLKKRNNLDIDEIDFTCHSINMDKDKRTEFKWTMHNVYNNTKKTVNEYYMYTTSDIGKAEKPEIVIREGNRELKFNSNTVKRCNGIQMSPFALTSPLPAGGNKKDVSVSMIMHDAFNFSRNEIVYLYPKNYGLKIGVINITLKLEGIDSINVTLHEIRRNRSVFEDIALQTGVPLKEGNIKCYNFSLSKNELNMDSIYYLLLSPLPAHLI